MKGKESTRKAADEGYTFIEVIVVLTIILLLSATVGFSAIRYIDSAKITSCKTQIDAFKLALQAYYLDCGGYPSKEHGLQALWIKPVIAPVPAKWSGPYIDSEIPLDAWGNSYIYRVPGENGLPYSIISYGADGKEGGQTLDEDIVSWKR